MITLNKNKIIHLVSCLLLVLLFSILPNKVYAEDIATGFTYELKFPDNQTDKQLNYYDLMMKPGQEQELTIVLSNPGKEAITVDLNLNGAKTNSNGVIEWANDKIKNDDSLKFKFEDIVSGPNKVDLAGGETKEVKLSVKMPQTSYDGIITGGLQLIREGQNENVSEANGSRVLNQYAYAVSIVLHETDKKVTPDLKYNRTYAGQQNYRNSILVNLSNVEAAFLNNLNIEAQISKKGSQEVLYEAKTTGMRMAPNTFIDFPISMNGDKMVAGKYTSHILATSGDQRWEWTEEFEITTKDADKFNARDVGLVQDNSINWGLIIGIVAGLFVLILLVFIILRITRRKKNNEKSSSKKKKTSSKKK